MSLQRIRRLVFSIVMITILGSFMFSYTTFNNKVLQNQPAHLFKESVNQDDPKLVRYVQDEYLHAPSKEPYNLINDTKYLKEMTTTFMPVIQNIVSQVFSDEMFGFFIEAGALDGQFLSNTLWLEKELNWTGILIEPDPENYKELLERNRKSWTSPSCISPTIYPKEIILKTFKRKINSKFSKSFFRGNSHDIDNTLVMEFDDIGFVEYNRVQCFPLYTYLLSVKVSKVNLLSLDTQGGEVEMLYNFPWSTVDVTMVIIETYNKIIGTVNKDIIKFMNKNNFTILAITQEPDYLFLKKTSHYLKKLNFKPLQIYLDKNSILNTNKTLYFEKLPFMETI